MATPKDTYGRDDVLIAALGVDPERFKKLFEQDPETNLINTDSNNDTALHLAAMKGNTPTINYLLKKGANVIAKDKFGAIPLHLAAVTGYTSAVDALTATDKNRKTIDTQDINGNTPLILAAKKGYGNTVRKLLEKGADTSLVNKQGETVAKLANPECAQIIAEHEARKKFEVKDAVSPKSPDATPVHGGSAKQER